MRALAVSAVLVALPLGAYAQEDVRAQIRAELMQDSRTAEMSAAELDMLVEALAQEALSSEEGATYLDAQAAPTFIYDAPPIASPSPFLAALSTPIVIAVLALIAGLLSLVIFMLRHKKGTPASDLQNS